MRKLAVCLLPIAVGLLFAAPVPKDERKDKDKIQSTWKMVSMESEGKIESTDDAKDKRLVITAEMMCVTERGEKTKEEIKYTLDDSKKPKTIDLEMVQPDGPKMKLLGIYELDDDTLKICINPSGDKRPTEFATSPGSSVRMLVLKRDKP
jgi:uncharacterized protein (TIGR03067 family)